MPGVKFDAMRGSKRKTAFPGFISRFIFVTDLLRKQSAKNPESDANLGLPGCQLPTASRCVILVFLIHQETPGGLLRGSFP